MRRELWKRVVGACVVVGAGLAAPSAWAACSAVQPATYGLPLADLYTLAVADSSGATLEMCVVADSGAVTTASEISPKLPLRIVVTAATALSVKARGVEFGKDTGCSLNNCVVDVARGAVPFAPGTELTLTSTKHPSGPGTAGPLTFAGDACDQKWSLAVQKNPGLTSVAAPQRLCTTPTRAVLQRWSSANQSWDMAVSADPDAPLYIQATDTANLDCLPASPFTFNPRVPGLTCMNPPDSSTAFGVVAVPSGTDQTVTVTTAFTGPPTSSVVPIRFRPVPVTTPREQCAEAAEAWLLNGGARGVEIGSVNAMCLNLSPHGGLAGTVVLRRRAPTMTCEQHPALWHKQVMQPAKYPRTDGDGCPGASTPTSASNRWYIPANETLLADATTLVLIKGGGDSVQVAVNRDQNSTLKASVIPFKDPTGQIWRVMTYSLRGETHFHLQVLDDKKSLWDQDYDLDRRLIAVASAGLSIGMPFYGERAPLGRYVVEQDSDSGTSAITDRGRDTWLSADAVIGLSFFLRSGRNPVTTETISRVHPTLYVGFGAAGGTVATGPSGAGDTSSNLGIPSGHVGFGFTAGRNLNISFVGSMRAARALSGTASVDDPFPVGASLPSRLVPVGGIGIIISFSGDGFQIGPSAARN